MSVDRMDDDYAECQTLLCLVSIPSNVYLFDGEGAIHVISATWVVLTFLDGVSVSIFCYNVANPTLGANSRFGYNNNEGGVATLLWNNDTTDPKLTPGVHVLISVFGSLISLRMSRVGPLSQGNYSKVC